MPFNPTPGTYYRMPVMFGPTPGPRQWPREEPFDPMDQTGISVAGKLTATLIPV